MSNDYIHDKQAAQLLPCVPTTNCRTVEGKQRHGTACPAYWRPGLAAKLREQGEEIAKLKADNKAVYIAGLEAARDEIKPPDSCWSCEQLEEQICSDCLERARLVGLIDALIDAKKGEG